jgi:hypothetical protein
MLTVAQLVALETQSSAFPLHAHNLFNRFPAKALSLRSLINAIKQQKCGYFAELRSLSLLQQATSFDDLVSQWNSGAGKLQPSDISAFANNVLQPRGVALKLVTSDSRALIFGPVAALATVPTIPMAPGVMLDVQTGAANVATGGAGIGGVLMGVGGLMASTGVGAGPGLVIFVVGASVTAFSSGVLIGLGAGQIQTSTTGGTSSTDQTDVTQPDGDSVSVPAAEVFGDFPEQVNADQLADAVATNDLSAIPDNFDGQLGCPPGPCPPGPCPPGPCPPGPCPSGPEPPGTGSA